MESGVGLKIVGLLFWPVLLMGLYYLFNKEGFMRRWREFIKPRQGDDS